MDAKGWHQRRVAEEVGTNASVVSRWLSGEMHPNLESIRATAEAFGVPVIEAMLAAEALTEEEVGVKRVSPDPDLLSDEEIVRQVAKRMGRREVDAPEVVVTRDPDVDLPPQFRGSGVKKHNQGSAKRSR